MSFIFSGIHNLEQHLAQLQNDSTVYRPSQCSSCGKAGLWMHGVYYRSCKNDPSTKIPIQRFLCSHCNSTCSSLPEYIPPRRVYHWLTQHIVLKMLLVTKNVCQAWKKLSAMPDLTPSLSTMRRWWLWLRRQHRLYEFHLCSVFPKLRFSSSTVTTFWQACLSHMPLSKVMFTLSRAAQIIP